MAILSFVRWSGSLPEAAGRTVEVQFALYQDQAGGTVLWRETQAVKVGADGRYSVLLGTTGPGGLPQALFQAGAARWIEVRLAGAAGEPPANPAAPARSLLAAVPYAFKAADAESLAGRAAADYVTREDLQSAVAAGVQTAEKVNPETSPTVTGTGTANYVPVWTGASTLGNSVIKVSGANVGIGATAPVYPLDVNGMAVARGGFKAEPNLAATATAGVNSPPIEFQASTYSSTTHAAIPQYFIWQVLPTGNNTNSPGAKLALSATSGTTTRSTGFSIGPTGLLTFAPGQTFPAAGLETTLNGVYAQLGAANTFIKPIKFAAGQTYPGAGTITGVAAGTGLTGGGTSGTPTLAIDTTVVPLLNAQNSFSNTNTFVGTLDSLGTVDLEANGVTSSFAPNLNSALLELSANAYNSTEGIPEALNFGWRAVATGGNTGSPGANLELFYGAGSAQPTATGLSIAPSGVINFASGQTFPGGGGGGGTITGITTSSPLTGGGTSGTVSLGLSTSALESALDAVYPQLAAANTFGSTQTVSTSAATGVSATAYGTISTGVFASGNTYGVSATSAGTGVQGQSTGGGTGVYGAGAIGVQAYGTAHGLSSSSNAAGGTGISSTDTSGTGAGILGASGTLPAVQAGAGVQGTGPNYGVYGATSSKSGFGVAGISTKNYLGTAGVYGSGTHGVWGETIGNIGVFGQLATTSQTFQSLTLAAGVWGDATASLPTQGVAGVIATSDDSDAGMMFNNSDYYTTLFLQNEGSAGITNTANSVPARHGLTTVLRAQGPGGVCGINGGGDVACTGQIKSLVPAGGGARKVETYAMQSPENWMEDFGSGELQREVAVVKIDPAFAETVTADASYHVFITPNGDCNGLYVIRKTATGFEVRESKGGTSSLTFDYRIVAKRRGYEAQRLTDVTERFKAETAQALPPADPGAAHNPRPKRTTWRTPGMPATPGTQDTPHQLPRTDPAGLNLDAGRQKPATHP